jgi:ADP-heptose:LPS heptosyltransferase
MSRIVVLRALGLGDLLTAVPALHALRAAHPDAELAVAAPKALAPLAALTGCVLVDAAPLQPLPPAAHGADLLVNLHGRGPQSHGVALSAAPRRLLAFRHAEVDATATMPAWRSGEHEVARWCRLLSESGIPADPARLDLPVPPLPAALERTRGATVIHPGAASGARRWPAARFAEVAAREATSGRTVIVTGGPGERPLAQRVAHAAGLAPGAVLAGETDLRTLAAIVAHAGRVVCGDTGVAHLATAFGVPSVVLFGPTSPEAWGPPAARAARHRVLWTGGSGDPHGARPHAGLLEIGTRDVLDELARLPS